MKIIGLTGGIASGKSTTRRMLEELGAHVLDADAIYHELIAPRGGQPSPLARAISGRFPGVLERDGAIDRRALGKRVFADPSERAALEDITHPAVAVETGRRFAALEADGVKLAIYDVPLLFEAGLANDMAGVIVVWAPREVQLARLMGRDALAREEAERRVASQLSLDDKRARATWVIDSSGSLDATRQQVAELWRELSRNL